MTQTGSPGGPPAVKTSTSSATQVSPHAASSPRSRGARSRYADHAWSKIAPTRTAGFPVTTLGDDRQLAAVAAGDAAAVRAALGMPEERADAVGDLGVDDVLHPTGGQLDLGRGQVHGG